jgi:putative membrane protein
MHWDSWGGPGFGMGFGWLMILFWVGVIAAVVWLISTLMQGKSRISQPSEPTAIDILKRRYAQGEISKDEYEQKKKDLLG